MKWEGQPLELRIRQVNIPFLLCISAITDPTYPDIEMEEQIKMVFNFTDAEIKRLLVVFKKLDKDKTGTVSRTELFDLPYFKHNPFNERYIAGRAACKNFCGFVTLLICRLNSLLDENMSDSLDIKEFASIYSVFSARATREQKLRLAFKV